MKSAKQILREMGFNKDAPPSTQKAFLRHLVAAANTTALTSISQVSIKKRNHLDESRDENKGMTQLEFDFSDSPSKRVS